MRAARAACWLSVTVLLASGCTGGPPRSQADRPSETGTTAPPSYQQYVALGDSYTAAPYVPATDLADGCLRSDGNYPSLVARRLEVDGFTDVSCSAADIADLRRPQRTFRTVTVPAQLDALRRGTDLVTLGIGGNDFNLFGSLLRTCASLRSTDPSGAPCTERLLRDGVRPAKQVAVIGRRLGSALRDIADASPRARVVLVGYPRIAPRTGSCPRLLPLAEGDYATADRVARLLRTAMRRAARSHDADFVDMYAASRGHDVCAKDPWVNGRFTDQLRALAFHPFADAMRAAATRIVTRLRQPL